jgi:hypothetical protein
MLRNAYFLPTASCDRSEALSPRLLRPSDGVRAGRVRCGARRDRLLPVFRGERERRSTQPRPAPMRGPDASRLRPGQGAQHLPAGVSVQRPNRPLCARGVGPEAACGNGNAYADRSAHRLLPARHARTQPDLRQHGHGDELPQRLCRAAEFLRRVRVLVAFGSGVRQPHRAVRDAHADADRDAIRSARLLSAGQLAGRTQRCVR